jgi:hypothetical protein
MIEQIEATLENTEELERVSNELFESTDTDGSGFVEGDELTTLLENVAAALEVPTPKPK